ncbi:MAG: KUP/HAK/KT family potassium transporter [Alphaproteobacteria bacterium]|nr:KUP/HAK/KT family potassium transporter [Alphaproteobacteria bacterium]
MSKADNGSWDTRRLLTALGVVYGDIGTSPLYAFREGAHAAGAVEAIGVASLMIWSLILVVLVKYVLVVLRFDNNGEGGILALAALAGRRKVPVVVMGICGAAMLVADGALTPAISVLSAVEGLKEVWPDARHWATWITTAILVGLFAVQFRGTDAVGRWFGPITLVWFVTLGVVGFFSMVQTPEVLRALNPMEGLTTLLHRPDKAVVLLGAVFLTVTGGEALYADLGHVGRKPIRVAWIFIVMPALALQYLGQAAIVLREPLVANPFYAQVPDILTLPMVVLATLATIIASQAVITGVFSLGFQAVALNWWPRMRIDHTSAHGRGQVYVRVANSALLVAAVLLVHGFGTSDKMASAYGLAVAGTMVLTTALLTRLVKSWLRLALFGFLAIDLMFLGATLGKFIDGGWVTAAMGTSIALIGLAWVSGVRLHRRGIEADAQRGGCPIGVKVVTRVPGGALFLTRAKSGVPPLLLQWIEATSTIPDTIVMLTIEIADKPFVPARDRITLGDTDGDGSQLQPLLRGDGDNPGFWRAVATYGFRQQPDLRIVARELAALGVPIDPDSVKIVVGHETVVAHSGATPLEKLVLAIYSILLRNAARPQNFFRLNDGRLVDLGFRVSAGTAPPSSTASG